MEFGMTMTMELMTVENMWKTRLSDRFDTVLNCCVSFGYYFALMSFQSNSIMSYIYFCEQAIYKEFISSTANNITSLLSDQADGIYHATDIELSGMKIKVIFLDTRSNRDHHYIRLVNSSSY